jgi:hypothetical protein
VLTGQGAGRIGWRRGPGAAGRPLPEPPEKEPPRLTLADIARVLRQRNAAKAAAQKERAEGGGEAEPA